MQIESTDRILQLECSWQRTSGCGCQYAPMEFQTRKSESRKSAMAI
ncbi:MAG: hypothetical protein ACKN85_01835 [Pirellula sp.]